MYDQHSTSCYIDKYSTKSQNYRNHSLHILFSYALAHPWTMMIMTHYADVTVVAVPDLQPFRLMNGAYLAVRCITHVIFCIFLI